MRRFQIQSLLVAAALLAVPAPGKGADAFPSKPLRVVVAQPPGGSTDAVTRMFASRMVEILGQQIVVDNRAGGGIAGMATQALVADANPDGYTLLAIVPNFTFTPALVKNIRVRPEQFAPVTLLSRDPYLLSVYPGVAAKSVKDLIALARARPGVLNMGSGNIGSGTHMISMLFLSEAGIRKEVTYIPYKGTGLAFLDLIAGRIHMAISSVVSGGVHVRAGRLRALGVTSTQRSPAWSNVPTLAEEGLAGFDATAWYGWVVPAATPVAVINKLSAAAGQAAKFPEIGGRIKSLGGEAVGSSPAEFRQLIAREVPRWRALIKDLGMTGSLN